MSRAMPAGADPAASHPHVAGHAGNRSVDASCALRASGCDREYRQIITGRSDRRGCAGHVARLAHRDVRVSRSTLAGLGFAATAVHSRLRTCICSHRVSRLLGAVAGLVACDVRFFGLGASDPFDGRCDCRAVAGAIPLCVLAGAQRVSESGAQGAGSGANARLQPWERQLARCVADGKALDRRRCGVDFDGNARGFRRRFDFQLQHVHDGHLSCLVRHVLGACGA